MGQHELGGTGIEQLEPADVETDGRQQALPVSPRRRKKRLVWLTILIIVLAGTTAIMLSSLSRGLKSGGVERGSTGQLLWPDGRHACIFAAADRESHRQLYDAMRTKDLAALGSMTKKRDMLILEDGTQVEVIEVDRSINAVRVVILDGAEKGQSCWVLRDYVSLSSHGKRTSSLQDKPISRSTTTPPVRDEPTSAGSAFRMVILPQGISLSVPKSWRGLSPDVAEQVQAASEAVVDLSAMEFDPEGYTPLLQISQPLEGHLGVIKLSIKLEENGFMTQDMQSGTTEGEMAELSETQRTEYAKAFPTAGMTLTQWHPMTLEEINSNYYYCARYQVGAGREDGASCFEQYQMHDRDKLVTFTLTYAIGDKALFDPICRKSLMSLKVQRNP